MKKAIAVLFVLVLRLSAQEIWPVPDWSTGTPESQGLDSAPLAALTEKLAEGEYGEAHSLLVVRHGVLVWEKYFRTGHPDSLHTLQSVSKSVTSAMIGIAIARGDITGVETPILDYFPGYEPKNLDERKRSIRLRHILTMRSGNDYHERGPGSPHYLLNETPTGWDTFYLDRPMIRKPGEHFQYDSGGVILMSAILQRATGLHADRYADTYLFPALGISKTRWFRNREGHPHTGGGLFLTSRDMARFGLLYLRDGRWNGGQLVPEQWVRDSFTEQVDLRPFDRPPDTGYGYLWWIMKPDPAGAGGYPVFAAKGYMGQFIFVIPEYDMVVVTTAGSMDEHMGDACHYLYTDVLEAVR
ncbi:serine hydrolase [bacterium]|nr:serine hydrolase [bacterium]